MKKTINKKCLISIVALLLIMVVAYLFTPFLKKEIIRYPISAKNPDCIFYKGLFGEGYSNCGKYLITVKINFFGTIYERIRIVNRIPVVDVDTFSKVRWGSYFKDKNNVFFNSYLIKEADAETFTVFDGGYISRDKNKVFYRLGNEIVAIKGADPQSFAFDVIIGSQRFAKDKNKIYFFPDNGYKKVKILDGVDPKSFDIFFRGDGSSHFFARDNNKVYKIDLYYDEKWIEVSGVDAQSFEILDDGGYGYFLAKDKNKVYKISDKTSVIGWADPQSFECNRGSLYRYVCKDKNREFNRN